jgi:hypothetical protein
MVKDKCYYEAKEKFEVFPSAYASGYMAKCRKKKGIVNKTEKGDDLKRWYAEDWRDEKGNICGSKTNKNIKKCRPRKRIDSNTPVTWNEMSDKEKKRAVTEKKKVGMGARASKVKSKKEEKITSPKKRKITSPKKRKITSPKRKAKTKKEEKITSPKRTKK